MRYEAIRKHEGQWVKIRPALQIYDHSAVLTDRAVEDAWCISDITEKSLTLTSRDTELSKVVGLDHIHHFMEDPEGQRTFETVGTLVMNVQLLLYQGTLHAEPVAPPGRSLDAFVPARPRASLLDAAARKRSRDELERAQKAFAWSTGGVNSALTAFADLKNAFERLGEDLRAAGHPIEDLRLRTVHSNVILLTAGGWWATLILKDMAANTIENARLKISQLDGPPDGFGLMVFSDDKGKVVSSHQYLYGLAAKDAPRWISESNRELAYTPMDLAQELLTKLLEEPNRRSR